MILKYTRYPAEQIKIVWYYAVDLEKEEIYPLYGNETTTRTPHEIWNIMFEPTEDMLEYRRKLYKVDVILEEDYFLNKL